LFFRDEIGYEPPTRCRRVYCTAYWQRPFVQGTPPQQDALLVQICP
jgi:hypothetical protein